MYLYYTIKFNIWILWIIFIKNCFFSFLYYTLVNTIKIIEFIKKSFMYKFNHNQNIYYKKISDKKKNG